MMMMMMMMMMVITGARYARYYQKGLRPLHALPQK